MPFEKGQSGNPGGRPKENAEIKALAREYSEEAILCLVQWMRSGDAKASPAAANALLNRGFGTPPQSIGGDPDNPLRIEWPLPKVALDQ